ncbi:MAG: thioredoxin family protein [Thermodesulfovibrionales bacterium]|nr:thioredoxin family protein [Thermodesulfovibrionales bacterium]
MKTIRFLIIVIASLIALNAFASTEIKWIPLKKGMEKAKADKKPIIVDFFFGKGCPRCEILQKTVYDNPSIGKRIMDEFIPVRVDLTKKLTSEEERLGTQYDFKNDCLLLFLDHNGNVIKDPAGRKLCFVDAIEPEWFMKYLDLIKESYKKQ